MHACLGSRSWLSTVAGLGYAQLQAAAELQAAAVRHTAAGYIMMRRATAFLAVKTQEVVGCSTPPAWGAQQGVAGLQAAVTVERGRGGIPCPPGQDN